MKRVTLEDTDAQLLDLIQASRKFRVPVQWLFDEALAGRMPCLNAGGRLLFHAPTVEGVLVIAAAMSTLKPRTEFSRE